MQKPHQLVKYILIEAPLYNTLLSVLLAFFTHFCSNFDQDNIVGSTVSDRQEKTTVNGSTVDKVSTFGNPCSNLAANENLVIVKTLKRCLNENTGCEIDNIVYTVEDRV